MGLFDYVYVDQPGFDPKEEFQTKDFDDMWLNRYDITAEGRLIRKTDGMEQVDKDVNFHGLLHFYNLRKNQDWIQCDAKFADGQLVEITTEVKTPQERGLRLDA